MELEYIKNSILEIRGKKVMLDMDLAKIYQVETKRLKESVRRNIHRFPDDFMFELTEEEWFNLRSQFASSSWGGSRYPPFAFTEQGVAMLSGLLNSDLAIQMNIAIMRAFVMIRQWVLSLTGSRLGIKSRIMETNQHVKAFKSYMLFKRYSENTIKVYTNALELFFRFFPDRKPESLTNEDITFFNESCILKKNLSSSYQNQVINAIKLFYRNRFNRSMEVDYIQRPRREKRLPNVLSKSEVKAILASPTNLKHRAMLSLIYACGQRRGELLHLRLTDIHSERHLLFIHQSKGKKDRMAPISLKVIDLLRDYYKANKPRTWLFEGQSP